MNAVIEGPATRPEIAMPDGKRRLLQAALKLAARGTGLGNLGIRELAREAELNPNTFYRHFKDMEDMAQCAARSVALDVMAGMQKVRNAAAGHADATLGAAEFFVAEVARNPDPYRVGIRELHGGSPAMRRILKSVLEEIAQLSVEQIEARNLVPGLHGQALYEAALAITYYMLYRALDVIETPAQRAQIADEIVRFIRAQFLGSLALQHQAR